MVVLSDSDTTNQSAIALDLRTETGNKIPGREAQETIPINPEETGTQGVMFRHLALWQNHPQRWACCSIWRR